MEYVGSLAIAIGIGLTVTFVLTLIALKLENRFKRSEKEEDGIH